MLYQSTCVGLGYGLYAGVISLEPFAAPQSNKGYNLRDSVTSSRPRNINPVPISYAFLPRLRGWLTLRGLALRRNLDLRRECFSHLCRYHVSILTSDTSRKPRSFPSQAYGTLRYHSSKLESAASVHGFSPDTFSAREVLFRPVSYYAFFKGWLLLSQPLLVVLDFLHPFPLSHDLGTLAGGQGCFPFDDGP